MGGARPPEVLSVPPAARPHLVEPGEAGRSRAGPCDAPGAASAAAASAPARAQGPAAVAIQAALSPPSHTAAWGCRCICSQLLRAPFRHAATLRPPSLSPPCPQVCLACASAFVVLKESQENIDPFVFSSIRFLIAAAVFSPFMRKAMRDERVVRAGVEIGAWAAGGAPPPRCRGRRLRACARASNRLAQTPMLRAMPLLLTQSQPASHFRHPPACRLPHPEHRHADR